MRVIPICALAVALLSTPAADQNRITVAARSIRPGELVVLTIATAAPASSVRVRAFDRDWMPFAADARTWRVLIGIDLDVVPGAYTVAVDAGSGPTEVRT